jgi:hypothetical protein
MRSSDWSIYAEPEREHSTTGIGHGNEVIIDLTNFINVELKH